MLIDIRTSQPIAGARVELKGPVERSTTTNPKGHFEFIGLPASSEYRFDISADGYDPGSFQNLVVIEGHTTDLVKIVMWHAEDYWFVALQESGVCVVGTGAGCITR